MLRKHTVHTAVPRLGGKIAFIFPSMLPLLSSPLAYVFLSPFYSFAALCHLAPIMLAASCGAGTSRLQRPSIRAGTHTRHQMLSAFFDDSRNACRRRPHLYDGFCARPRKITGRLHQHQGQSLPQHRQTAHAALTLRWRSGPFEGPASVKPPALPEDTYSDFKHFHGSCAMMWCRCSP
jgi:hypothetical protein